MKHARHLTKSVSQICIAFFAWMRRVRNGSEQRGFSKWNLSLLPSCRWRWSDFIHGLSISFIEHLIRLALLAFSFECVWLQNISWKCLPLTWFRNFGFTPTLCHQAKDQKFRFVWLQCRCCGHSLYSLHMHLGSSLSGSEPMRCFMRPVLTGWTAFNNACTCWDCQIITCRANENDHCPESSYAYTDWRIV